MFINIPTVNNIKVKLLPPYEKKGSGTPVSGTSADTALTFKNTCIPSHAVSPQAKTCENLSGAFPQTLKARYKNHVKRRIIMLVPKNPSSSPITAKTESVAASGKNKNFCRDCPSPTPKIPPDPRAICDWDNCKLNGGEPERELTAVVLD